MVVLAELSVKVNSATSSRRSALNDPRKTDIKKNYCCFLAKTFHLVIRSYKCAITSILEVANREVNLTILELRARLQMEL